MERRFHLFLAAFWLFSLLPPSQAPGAQLPTATNPVEKYKPRGYVNDFAAVLDSKAEAQLNQICKDLDGAKRTQMAFVTISSLEGVPIKDFTTQLANQWGVGYKDTNRGIVVLLAVKDRQYRISTGLGLESILTDQEADRLGREMVPILRKGEYGEALVHLARELQTEIEAKVK